MNQQEKCLKYFNDAIESNSWKLNERIPPVSRISSKLDISKSVIYNIINRLEKIGILKNWGRNNIYLIRKDNSLYVSRLKEYIKLINKTATEFSSYPWTVKINGNKIIGVNDINGTTVETNRKELLLLSKQISINDLINFKGSNFNELRRKYLRQRQIRPIALILKREDR